MRRPSPAAAILIVCAATFAALLAPSIAARHGYGFLAGALNGVSDETKAVDNVFPWLPWANTTSSEQVPEAWMKFSSSSVSKPPAAPLLAFSVTDDRTEAAPGETVTYWVTIENLSGIESIVPLSVSLSIPKIFSHVAVPPEATFDGTMLRWDAVLVPAGGISLRFDATLSSDAPDGSPFTALAQGAGAYGQDTTVVKVPAPQTGCISVMTLLRDAGGVPYTGTPPEFTFVADLTSTVKGSMPSYSASRVDANLWMIPGIPAGIYVVRTTPPADWMVSTQDAARTVTVDGGTDCTPLQVPAERLPSAPSFSMTLLSSRSVIRRGETTTITVAITNTSSDTSPAGAVIALSPQWPLAEPAQWTLPSLASGRTHTVTALVQISPTAETIAPNTPLTITASGPGTSAVTTVVGQPLGSCIIARKNAFSWAGQHFTDGLQQFGFSVILDNREEQLLDANGFTMFRNVQPGSHRVTERFIPGWNPTGVSPPGGDITVRDGDCPTVTFENTQIAPPLQVAMQFDAVDDTAPLPGLAFPGDTVHYALRILNTSPQGRPATGIDLRVPLPESLGYMGGANETGGAYNAKSRSVEWTGLTLSPGITTLWFDAVIPAGTPPDTHIVTVATLGGPELTAITAQTDTVVLPVQAQTGCMEIVQQIFASDAIAFASSAWTQPFGFQYFGPATGGVPQLLTVTASPAGATGSVDSMAMIARGSVTLTGLLPGTYLIAPFPVSGYETGDLAPRTVEVLTGDTCVGVGFTTRPVSDQPRFSITKTDNQETVLPGHTVTSTITVRNTSDVRASSPVIVENALPPFLTFLRTAGDIPGIYDAGSSAITWLIPSLLPGQSASLLLETAVDPGDAVLPATINDTATMTYAGTHAGAATDTTVILPPPKSPLMGCIRVTANSTDRYGKKPFPQPEFVLRLDDNEVVQSVNPYGIALFEKIPVGEHSIVQILPPQTGQYQWKQVSLTPQTVFVTANTCTSVTVVNREVNLPLMNDPGPACGDGFCANAPWVLWPETCKSCPVDCGLCPVSSVSSSSTSSSVYSVSSEPGSSSSVSSSSDVSESSSTSTSMSASVSTPVSLPALYCDHRMVFLSACPVYDPDTHDRATGTVFFQPPYIPAPGMNLSGIANPRDCLETCDRIKTIGECCVPRAGCMERTDTQCGSFLFFPYTNDDGDEETDCDSAYRQNLCGGAGQ